MTNKNLYQTPEEYLFPLHFNRPRFKNDMENVLLYMADKICSHSDLIDNESLDFMIKGFPGNSELSKKTIANWRTEISSLLGLVQINDNHELYPSLISKRLVDNSDLFEFFKNFSMKLQFPNGINKEHYTKTFIEKGIKFKPLNFLYNLMENLSKHSKSNSYITKDELTYVVFDDLRFTTGILSELDASKLIINNRKKNTTYLEHNNNKSHGDQTRTAGDFLDYMMFGNLLHKKSDKYFFNSLEIKFIEYAATSVFFDGYNIFYKKKFDTAELKPLRKQWFDYVNQLNFKESKTNISSIINPESKSEIELDLGNGQTEVLSTKDIGDMGEAIVVAHEKRKLELLDLGDKKHLVQFLPTDQAMGFDVKSLDEMENQIFIEVKTTLSNKPVTQNRVTLTKNEWNAAYTHKNNYYIYRLIINDEERKLLVLKNPVLRIAESIISGNEIIKPVMTGNVDLRFKPEIFEEVEIL